MSKGKMLHPLLSKVEDSLDIIRPYLKKDGGNVEVVGISDDNIVSLRMVGACETCPQSYMTLKAGIEETIKKSVPEIQSVIALS